MTAMSTVISLIQSEAAHLHSDLARLDAADWLRPSACTAWTVGDVLAHLTQGARTWSASLTRAMAGDAGPPPGEQPLGPGERGSEATAQRAIAFRQSMTSEALLQSYAESYRQLQQVLERLTAAHWQQPCYHRRGTMLLSDYVGLRLQELLVHGWDMRSAWDAAVQPSVPPAAVLLRLGQRWLSKHHRPGPLKTATLVPSGCYQAAAVLVSHAQHSRVRGQGYRARPAADPANADPHAASVERTECGVPRTAFSA